MNRVFRAFAAAAAIALVLTSLGGCAHQVQLNGTCGIVVDGSLSGNATSGFNATSQLSKNLDTFLASSGCRYAVFAPINGDSLSSICSEPELDMDPPIQGVSPTTVQAAGHKLAMKRAEDELHCARYDKLSVSGASDITGGLIRIKQAFKRTPGPYNVLVVSDFISYDSSLKLVDVSLATYATRTAIINRLASEGQLPSLSGIRIQTAGFGTLFGRDTERRVEFGQFWQEYMARAHATSFTE